MPNYIRQSINIFNCKWMKILTRFSGSIIKIWAINERIHFNKFPFRNLQKNNFVFYIINQFDLNAIIFYCIEHTIFPPQFNINANKPEKIEFNETRFYIEIFLKIPYQFHYVHFFSTQFWLCFSTASFFCFPSVSFFFIQNCSPRLAVTKV